MRPPETRPGLPSRVAQIAIALGVMMLAASYLVPEHALSRATWDAEHARKFQQAAFKLHKLSHEVTDASEPTAAAELAAAQNEFDKIESELEAAIRRPRRLSGILFWSGVALAGFGALSFVVNSQADR